MLIHEIVGSMRVEHCFTDPGADNNMSEYDFARVSGNYFYSDRCRAELDPL